MQLSKGRSGFLMGVVGACAGMAIFASGAFAGFVVDVQVDGVEMPGKGGPGGPQSMDAVLKLEGKKSRLDVEKLKVSVISQGGNDMTVLMHEMKMKTVQPVPRAKPVAEGKESELDKPKATGKKDKISGFEVEEYVVEKPDQKITIWLTQDAATQKLREGLETVLAKQVKGKEGFDYKSMPGCPIRVIVDVPAKSETKANGKTVERPASTAKMTVTSIKEEGLADSVFEAPADYQDLAKMMQNAGPGMPPGGAGAAKPRGVAPAKP
jgi:hypothetical protein